MATPGLILTNTGTTAANTRVLCALGGAVIPKHYRARLVGFKQMLTIACEVPTQEPEGQGVPATILRECTVTDPYWHFPDGDVVWYFRVVPFDTLDMPQAINPGDDRAIDPYPTLPAILVNAAGNPINNGVPPGNPIVELPQLRAMVNPYGYKPRGFPLKVELPTPCRLIAYASVWQPGNQSRAPARPRPGGDIQQDSLTVDDGLCREDHFWLAYPAAYYYRIGIEMCIETRFKCASECRDAEECCK